MNAWGGSVSSSRCCCKSRGTAGQIYSRPVCSEIHMPLARVIGIVSIAALVPVAALCVSCSKELPAEAVRVEVWYLGDFGGTVRFADAVEDAVFRSPAFRESSGQKPGTLIVRVP